MTATGKRAKLTALDVEVLKAAKAGELRQEEWGKGGSYIEAGSRSRSVTRQVGKLSAGDGPLLQLGERDRRWSRPWELTAAGRAVLDAHQEKS